MKISIGQKELKERISLNFIRLKNDPYYGINEAFSPADYSWYGDKEGRLLLAAICHYKISGEKLPVMEQLMHLLPEKLNSEGYLGPVFRDRIHEEQLSGHSWLLRGLCEHYTAFGDFFSFSAVEKIVKKLYLPLSGRICSYPILRSSAKTGGVSGETVGELKGWLLSTDIGCAFMSIDGLSHAFEITKNRELKALLDEMIDFYLSVDKITLKAQTHCTLTAARGMLRMYRNTSEEKYLKGAGDIFRLYTDFGGMTKTCQNLNWWGREDSWTEPCAVVDSLMVATELYKVTGKEQYRSLAARIYHNGLATAQRDNGGAGTDTLICEGSPEKHLRPLMYEAYFCCTMRLAEGLWFVNENKDLLFCELSGEIVKKSDGTYSDGDLLYCLPDDALLPFAEEGKAVDGQILYPIVKAYKVPKEIFMTSRQKILF